MDRQSRPLTGWAKSQGWPTVAAFRGCEFRRSATLTFEGRRVETDNWNGSPPGCAARAHSRMAQTHHRERVMLRLLNQTSATACDARLLRGACHRAGQRPDPLARNDADGWSSNHQRLSLRGARSATKQSLSLGWSSRFGETNPRSDLAKRTRDFAKEDVDGRNKSGHDERWVLAKRTRSARRSNSSCSPALFFHARHDAFVLDRAGFVEFNAPPRARRGCGCRPRRSGLAASPRSNCAEVNGGHTFTLWPRACSALTIAGGTPASTIVSSGSH